jgi:hypothetical protein
LRLEQGAGEAGKRRCEEKVTFRTDLCSLAIHAHGALLDAGNPANRLFRKSIPLA